MTKNKNIYENILPKNDKNRFLKKNKNNGKKRIMVKKKE